MEAPSMAERRMAGLMVKTFFLRNRRGRGWAVPASLAHEPVRFEGNTGGSLSATWFPHAQPIGVVVLAHPDKRYGQHWFVKEGWVAFLLSHGYEVLTFDFVGYGQSNGPATYYHEDVLAAARYAQRQAGGLPVHVIGVSMGAFAVANASPHLDFVHSILLESPYPSFGAWYGDGPGANAMRAFDRLFPRTSAMIQADRNIRRAAPKRILVVYAENDDVTRPELSRTVAAAGPRERTRAYRLDGLGHLEGFAKDPSYRARILTHLKGADSPQPQPDDAEVVDDPSRTQKSFVNQTPTLPSA